MEPPARLDSESIRDEKVKVLKAIAPIEPKNLVRGQFHGYRDEKGVATEFAGRDFCRIEAGDQLLALERRSILHPAGKCLPVTCTEIVGRFPQPPATVSLPML